MVICQISVFHHNVNVIITETKRLGRQLAFNTYLLAGWVNRHTTENEIMLLKDKAGRSINRRRRRRREGKRF